MGIQNFSKFLKTINIAQTSTEHIEKISDYKSLNVYIDLPIFMFSGCIAENKKKYNEESIYDETLVAETAFEILYSNVCYLYAKFNINKIVCYIDGLRPNMKMFTSRNRKKNNLNIQLTLKYLCKLINENLRSIRLKNLILGESESESFQRRDVYHPTLILTEDSDIFHISYNYIKQSEYDIVFIGNKYLKVLYDMSNLNFKMPRLAFLILMMLKGSDFTDKIFTDSMVEAIGKIWMKTNINTKYRLDICSKYREINNISKDYYWKERQIQIKNTSRKYESLTLNMINYNKILLIDDDDDNKNSVMIPYDYNKSLKYEIWKKYTNVIYRIPNIYSFTSVKTIIKLFLEILILLKRKKSHIGFNWNACNNKNKNKRINNDSNCDVCTRLNETTSIDSIINSITWSVNYSSIGSFYQFYDDTLYYKYTLVNTPFNFYTSIICSDYSIMNDSEITLSVFKQKIVKAH